MAQRLGKPRKSGSPTAATARKIGILLDLVRNRRISLRGCEQTYAASERTLLRDLQELRNIGKEAGFDITDRERGDIFELSEFKAKPSGVLAGQKRLRMLMKKLFEAFGDPVHELAEGLSDGGGSAGDEAAFLHVIQPQLVDGTSVGRVYRDLDAAWQKDARVEFRYKGQLRTIEPAAAVVRAGRYYLVGRDIAKGRNGWRIFSMDLIERPIRRVGGFTRKAPPAKYLSGDTVGFFKGDGEPNTVDVTFSRALAASATSRKWQEAQTVRKNTDGTITISFIVDDVDEVVRWALGFGDEAWVSAPRAAVARTRELLGLIREHYS